MKTIKATFGYALLLGLVVFYSVTGQRDKLSRLIP